MTELAAIRRPLALFAEGVAGLPLELDTVERKGSPMLLVPESIDRFDVPEHNRRAFRLAVLQRIARRKHGVEVFEFEVAADMFADLILEGCESQPVRALVVLRAGSDLDRFLRLVPKPELVRVVFEVLEVARINASVCRSYPGVVADVVRGNRYEAAQRPAAANDTLPYVLMLWSWGFRASPDLPILRLADAVLAPEATVYRSMEVALMICAHIAVGCVDVGVEVDQLGDPAEDSSDDIQGAPLTSDGDGVCNGEDRPIVSSAFDIPEGPGPASLGDLAEEDYAYAFAGSLAGDDQQLANQWRSSQPNESPEATASDSDGLRLSGPHPPRRTQDRAFRYPEWDYHRATYHADWCRLIERRVDGQEQEFMGGVRRDHSILRAQIRRRLSAIRPEQRVRVHGTSDGDELSIDAIIGTVIDRRAGRSPDDQLYIRRDRAERDVAAAFLIDLSRSTDSPVTVVEPEPVLTTEGSADRYDPFGPGYWDIVDFTPAPVGRRVIEVAKEAVAVMCESLQTLGDRHAIYGFSGRGRQQVDFLVAKEFGDRPCARTWSALGAMEPMSYTRMGPSIRHATSKLVSQGARTRILLVISDGYPQDEGYGPDPNDSDYGLHDTAQALREAESVGVTTFCITVDPAGHDYLRRMCREQRYLVIDDMGALTTELEKIYAALTLR